MTVQELKELLDKYANDKVVIVTCDGGDYAVRDVQQDEECVLIVGY